jgi:hypothetical protein
MSFYEKTGAAAAGGSHRRKWDTTEYEIKANERLAKEQEEMEKKKGGKRSAKLIDGIKPPPPKKLLEAREYKVGLLVIFSLTTSFFRLIWKAELANKL